MPHSPLRWWLRFPLAAALAWLMAVYEWSDYRTIDLADPPGLLVHIEHYRLSVPRYTPTSTTTAYIGPDRGWHHVWGDFSPLGGGDWWLHVPLWLFALPFAGATAWAWWPRRTPPKGLCPKCGYDRAGIGKDAVCPECGAKAEASS